MQDCVCGLRQVHTCLARQGANAVVLTPAAAGAEWRLWEPRAIPSTTPRRRPREQWLQWR